MAFMLQNKESVVALVSGLTDPEERSSWSQPLNHHRKGRHTPPFTFFLVQTIGNTATRGLIRAPTVVGVLVEVPVMPSVCSFCNRTRHWFPAEI
jgi:hypothetical protein